MVGVACTAWRDVGIACVILMAIKTAFLSVRRGRVADTIKGMGIDGDVSRWMACFLSNRSVEMVIEGNVME